MAFAAHGQVSLSIHQLPKCRRQVRSQEYLGQSTSFCGKETEAWRGIAIRPGSRTESVAGLGFEPKRERLVCGEPLAVSAPAALDRVPKAPAEGKRLAAVLRSLKRARVCTQARPDYLYNCSASPI